jgi:hypothetical protein
VEFGAGDGMHGVAEIGVYVIFIGNGIGSLGILPSPFFPSFSAAYLSLF